MRKIITVLLLMTVFVTAKASVLEDAYIKIKGISDIAIVELPEGVSMAFGADEIAMVENPSAAQIETFMGIVSSLPDDMVTIDASDSGDTVRIYSETLDEDTAHVLITVISGNSAKGNAGIAAILCSETGILNNLEILKNL